MISPYGSIMVNLAGAVITAFVAIIVMIVILVKLHRANKHEQWLTDREIKDREYVKRFKKSG